MKEIQKTFVKYVSANVLGMVGISCYILADTFFVAQGVGANGLAALNLAVPMYSLIYGLGLMIGMGAATRFSLSKNRKSYTQAVYFGILAALFFLVLTHYADPIASLFGADAVIKSDTATYLRVILCFSPMFLFHEIILSFARNNGAPRLAMASMIIGSLSNVVLDYIFIFPMKLGMFGAALATGISPVVGLLILSLHFIRKKNTFHLVRAVPSLSSWRDICVLGASSLVNELSFGIVMAVMNLLFLQASGNLGVAAYGIAANIALVVISIFTGISQGMQPLISRLSGEGKDKEVRQVLRMGICTAMLLSALVFVGTLFFAPSMAEVFNRDHDVLLTRYAAHGMRLYFSGFLFAGINIITAAYFGARGEGGKGFWISICRGCLVVVPSALILSALFGITGIWISMPVAELLVLFLGIWFLQKGRKKHFHLN